MARLPHHRVILQCACLFAVSLTSPLTAQEIRGKVVEKETKTPLPSTIVILESTSFGTLADSAGEFMISGFQPGLCVLAVRRIGFKTGRIILNPEGGKSITLLVELEEEPIPLKEVQVVDSVRLQRLATLGKTIISSQELLQSGTKSLATFMRVRYPGLFPSSLPPGRVIESYNRLRFVVYLNGALVQYTSDVLDTMVDVENIDYIEVYRGFGTTPRSNRGSNERVVHIHTKIPDIHR